MAFKALEISGMALEFMPEELRADRDIAARLSNQKASEPISFARLEAISQPFSYVIHALLPQTRR